MRSILLLPLVARCIETIDVCIWRMFVFMSVVVIVWGSVGMFVVKRSLLKIYRQIGVTSSIQDQRQVDQGCFMESSQSYAATLTH